MILARKGLVTIYGESHLLPYTEGLDEKCNKKINSIINTFKVYGAFPVNIYLFLDEEQLNKFVNKNPEWWTYDVYKKAYRSYDSIVIACDKEKLINKQFHYANVFAHMYFHILYNSVGRQVEDTLWYEEGLAQLLSGERNMLDDEEKFKEVLLRKVFDDRYQIPMIEELNDPDLINSDKYNGYTISYMLVRYLLDRSSDKNVFTYFNLSNPEKIRTEGKSIINRAYNYYGTLLGLPGYEISLNSIASPKDLMDYMNLYITHGWIDIYGNRHEHSLEGIRDIYRINSLDQVVDTGLATCIEQAMFEHYMLDHLNIENKILVNRLFEAGNEESGKVKLHCFCAYCIDDYWYYFEHAKKDNRGIYKFRNFNDLCYYQYRKMDVTRFLTEIPEIPVGYTLGEFNKYVNTFEILGRGKKLR